MWDYRPIETLVDQSDDSFESWSAVTSRVEPETHDQQTFGRLDGCRGEAWVPREDVGLGLSVFLTRAGDLADYFRSDLAVRLEFRLGDEFVTYHVYASIAIEPCSLCGRSTTCSKKLCADLLKVARIPRRRRRATDIQTVFGQRCLWVRRARLHRTTPRDRADVRELFDMATDRTSNAPNSGGDLCQQLGFAGFTSMLE